MFVIREMKYTKSAESESDNISTATTDNAPNTHPQECVFFYRILRADATKVPIAYFSAIVYNDKSNRDRALCFCFSRGVRDKGAKTPIHKKKGKLAQKEKR